MFAVVNHAKIGVDLLNQYKSIYTNFYISPLQLFCLVNLCDAVVQYDGHGDTTPRTVEFCFTSLEEAKIGYPVAGPLQKMFRLSLSEYGIAVPNSIESIIGDSARLGPEQLLDACTRTTYKQPITQILPNMEANLGPDFMRWWHHTAESRYSEPHGKGKKVEIGSLLNL